MTLGIGRTVKRDAVLVKVTTDEESLVKHPVIEGPSYV